MIDNTNFVEKYRAKKYLDLVGQEKAIEEVKAFLKEFPKRKALLLYGPPGTGKTTLAWIAALSEGWEAFELNSSDLRNRAKLEAVLKPAAKQMSLFKKGKILIVDEVDGVTGTDIGGIPELIRIIEQTDHPIIITGNDIWQSKLSDLRQKCKVVEMKALTTDAIMKYLGEVATKEHIKAEPFILRQLAVKSQGDIRAALNDLQAYMTDKTPLTGTDLEKRNKDESIFNILRLIFKERQDFLNLFDTTDMSLDEILLWIEENIPREYANEALAKAYHALSNADIFRGRIYRQQYWHFLVYQNIFQSAGIAHAKKQPSQTFTKYERPKRVLKIWLNNQNIAKKKTIAQKYARFVHCSVRRALRDFELLRPLMQKPSVQEQLHLTDEEKEYLSKEKAQKVAAV